MPSDFFSLKGLSLTLRLVTMEDAEDLLMGEGTVPYDDYWTYPI